MARFLDSAGMENMDAGRVEALETPESLSRETYDTSGTSSTDIPSSSSPSTDTVDLDSLVDDGTETVGNIGNNPPAPKSVNNAGDYSTGASNTVSTDPRLNAQAAKTGEFTNNKPTGTDASGKQVTNPNNAGDYHNANGGSNPASNAGNNAPGANHTGGGMNAKGPKISDSSPKNKDMDKTGGRMSSPSGSSGGANSGSAGNRGGGINGSMGSSAKVSPDTIAAIGNAVKEAAKAGELVYQNDAKIVQTTLRIEDYDPIIQEGIEKMRAAGYYDYDILNLLQCTSEEEAEEYYQNVMMNDPIRTKRMYEAAALHNANPEFYGNLVGFNNFDEARAFVEELKKQRQAAIDEKNTLANDKSFDLSAIIDELDKGLTFDEAVKSVSGTSLSDVSSSGFLVFNPKKRTGSANDFLVSDLYEKYKDDPDFIALKKAAESEQDYSDLKEKYKLQAQENKERMAELQKQIAELTAEIDKDEDWLYSQDLEIDYQVNNIDPYVYNEDFEDNNYYDDSAADTLRKYEDNYITKNGSITVADEDVADILLCVLNGEEIPEGMVFTTEEDLIELFRKWTTIECEYENEDGTITTKKGVMSQEEIEVFNYIYNTEGKEAAVKYAKEIAATMDNRWLQTQRYNDTKFATKNTFNKVVASVGSVFITPGEGMVSILYSMNDAYQSARGNDTRLMRTHVYSRGQTWRGAVSQSIENSRLRMVYDTGMSMADTGVLILANYLTMGTCSPYLATALMGTRAYAYTLNDCLDKGLSENQAIIMASGAMIAESVFENYSLGHLAHLEKHLGNLSEKIIGRLTKSISNPKIRKIAIDLSYRVAGMISQAFAEGEEEFGTEVFNYVFDIFVTKDLSDYSQAVQHYLDLGYSENEAAQLAFKEGWDRFEQAFNGGFLSGLFFGLGGSHKAARRASYGLSQQMYSEYEGNGKSVDLLDAITINREELEIYEEAFAKQAKMGNSAVATEDGGLVGKDESLVGKLKGLLNISNEITLTAEELEILRNGTTSMQAQAAKNKAKEDSKSTGLDDNVKYAPEPGSYINEWLKKMKSMKFADEETTTEKEADTKPQPTPKVEQATKTFAAEDISELEDLLNLDYENPAQKNVIDAILMAEEARPNIKNSPIRSVVYDLRNIMKETGLRLRMTDSLASHYDPKTNTIHISTYEASIPAIAQISIYHELGHFLLHVSDGKVKYDSSTMENATKVLTKLRKNFRVTDAQRKILLASAERIEQARQTAHGKYEQIRATEEKMIDDVVQKLDENMDAINADLEKYLNYNTIKDIVKEAGIDIEDIDAIKSDKDLLTQILKKGNFLINFKLFERELASTDFMSDRFISGMLNSMTMSSYIEIGEDEFYNTWFSHSMPYYVMSSNPSAIAFDELVADYLALNILADEQTITDVKELLGPELVKVLDDAYNDVFMLSSRDKKNFKEMAKQNRRIRFAPDTDAYDDNQTTTPEVETPKHVFDISFDGNQFMANTNAVKGMTDENLPEGYTSVEAYKADYVKQMIADPGFENVDNRYIFVLCQDPVMFHELLVGTDRVDKFFTKNFFTVNRPRIEGLLKNVSAEDLDTLLRKPYVVNYLTNECSIEDMRDLIRSFNWELDLETNCVNHDTITNILCGYNIEQLSELIDKLGSLDFDNNANYGKFCDHLADLCKNAENVDLSKLDNIMNHISGYDNEHYSALKEIYDALNNSRDTSTTIDSREKFIAEQNAKLKDGVNYVTAIVDGVETKLIITKGKYNNDLANIFGTEDFEITDVTSLGNLTFTVDDSAANNIYEVSYELDGENKSFYITPSYVVEGMGVVDINYYIKDNNLFGAKNFNVKEVDVDTVKNEVLEGIGKLSYYDKTFSDSQYGGRQENVNELINNYLDGKNLTLSETQKARSLISQIKQYYPNISNEEMGELAYYFSKGGCFYTAHSNSLITYLANQSNGEKFFEQTFGYEMKAPDGTFNYELLAFDIFLDRINKEFNGSSSDAIAAIRKGTFIVGSSDAYAQGYKDIFQRFFEEHGIKYQYTTSGVENKTAKNDILKALANNPNQFYIISGTGAALELVDDSLISIDNIVDEALQDAEINGKIVKNIGGHAMTVTGITEDGDLIISSWGKKYIFRAELLDEKSSSFTINSHSFDIPALNNYGQRFSPETDIDGVSEVANIDNRDGIALTASSKAYVNALNMQKSLVESLPKFVKAFSDYYGIENKNSIEERLKNVVVQAFNNNSATYSRILNSAKDSVRTSMLSEIINKYSLDGEEFPKIGRRYLINQMVEDCNLYAAGNLNEFQIETHNMNARDYGYETFVFDENFNINDKEVQKYFDIAQELNEMEEKISNYFKEYDEKLKSMQDHEKNLRYEQIYEKYKSYLNQMGIDNYSKLKDLGDIDRFEGIALFSTMANKRFEESSSKFWIQDEIQKRANVIQKLGEYLNLGSEFDAKQSFLSGEYKKMLPPTEIIDEMINTKVNLALLASEEAKDLVKDKNSVADYLSYYEDAFNNLGYIPPGMVGDNVIIENGKSIYSPLFFIEATNNLNSLDKMIVHEFNHFFEGAVLDARDDYFKTISGWVYNEYSSDKAQKFDESNYVEFNEIINEMIAQEITEEMHKNGIYIFSNPDTATYGGTDYERSRYLASEFFNKYKKEIIASRRDGNIQIIYDAVGKENFDALNNLINESAEYFGMPAVISSAVQDINSKISSERATKLIDFVKQKNKILGEMDDHYAKYQQSKANADNTLDTNEPVLVGPYERLGTEVIDDEPSLIDNTNFDPLQLAMDILDSNSLKSFLDIVKLPIESQKAVLDCFSAEELYDGIMSLDLDGRKSILSLLDNNDITKLSDAFFNSFKEGKVNLYQILNLGNSNLSRQILNKFELPELNVATAKENLEWEKVYDFRSGELDGTNIDFKLKEKKTVDQELRDKLLDEANNVESLVPSGKMLVEDYINNREYYLKQGITAFEQYLISKGIKVFEFKNKSDVAEYFGDGKLYLFSRIDDIILGKSPSAELLEAYNKYFVNGSLEVNIDEMKKELSQYLTPEQLDAAILYEKHINQPGADMNFNEMLDDFEKYLTPEEIEKAKDISQRGVDLLANKVYTEEELNAIFNYTNFGGIELNSFLFGGDLGERFADIKAVQNYISGQNGNRILTPEDGDIVKLLDTAIKMQMYSDAILSFRGTADIFDTKGNKLDPEKLAIGDVIYSDGYLSTSILKDYNYAYREDKEDVNILLKMVLPPNSGKAAYIENTTGVHRYGQMELLYARQVENVVVGRARTVTIGDKKVIIIPVAAK